MRENCLPTLGTEAYSCFLNEAEPPTMKLLIIDDHAVVRRGMQFLLMSHFKGIEIGEAEEAKSGLASVIENDWDIVVLDIGMPGRNGMDLIQEIKAVKPEVPILVISGHPEKDYAVRALKLGAAGFVSKESAAEVLVTAVERVLAGSKYISMSLAEQLAGAIGGNSPSTPHQDLSNRELQVLKLIALGKSIKDIGAELALSPKTIATYRSRIAEKMGLDSNVELTRYAIQNHLVD
jgi:two-component system, NarL family, invasion response regulator UvrY